MMFAKRRSVTALVSPNALGGGFAAYPPASSFRWNKSVRDNGVGVSSGRAFAR
ncbi:MAG: hypothetical protein ACRCXB_22225 [Aeromonadaceae bacterium]